MIPYQYSNGYSNNVYECSRFAQLVHQAAIACMSICLLITTCSHVCYSDSWLLPTNLDAKSRNGKHQVKIVVNKNKIGHCFAKVMTKHSHKPVLLWERYLVNDFCPSRIIITDDAKFMVTLGERELGGKKCALVVYGIRGQLIHVHSLDSLGASGPFAKGVLGSVWWLRNSIMFFDRNQQHLNISLESGEIIIVRLKDGKVIYSSSIRDVEKGRHLEKELSTRVKNTRDAVVRLSLQHIESTDGITRRMGVIHLGNCNYVSARKRLEEIAENDKAYFLRGKERLYYVRVAAKSALQRIGPSDCRGVKNIEQR